MQVSFPHAAGGAPASGNGDKPHSRSPLLWGERANWFPAFAQTVRETV